MPRAKQRKRNAGSALNSSANEIPNSRPRRAAKGRKSSVYGEDESKDVQRKLAHTLVTVGGKGKKGHESFQHKYERRYDELVYTESADFGVSDRSKKIVLGPRSSKTRSDSADADGAELETDAARERQALKNLRGRKHCALSYNTTSYVYSEEQDLSVDMHTTSEVVLPGTETRAEVVVDRSPNSGSSVATYAASGTSTWGLGYVGEGSSDSSAPQLVEIKNVELDGHDERALLGVKLVPRDDSVSRFRKDVQKPSVGKSKHRKGSKSRVGQHTGGFLSIGGLKIYTTDLQMSDSADSCTDQMDEDFEAEDTGNRDNVRRSQCKERRFVGRGRRKKPSPSGRLRFGGIDLSTSESDDSSEASDSDISIELVNDYLANCEGLSADIDNPDWVSRNHNSLEEPDFARMDTRYDTESSEDMERETREASGSGSELDEVLKLRYMVNASVLGQEAYEGQLTQEVAARGDSDLGVEDLLQKALFSYDSDSTAEADDDEDILLSDDEVRIRYLDLDDKACVRELENQENRILNNEAKGVSNTSACTEAQLRENETFLGELELNDKDNVALVSQSLSKDSRGNQFSSSLPLKMFLKGPDPTQMWPVHSGRFRKTIKRFPGKVKKNLQRQETIAEKRRERAVKRGFDVTAVNKLTGAGGHGEAKKDIIAFKPMDQRDRAQVHRLATIYKLKSGSQGTGRRRFVVVSVTENTSMPSGEGKTRLLKLLGQNKSHHGEATQRSGSLRTPGGEEVRKLKKKRSGRPSFWSVEDPVKNKGKKKFRDVSGFFSKASNKTGLKGHSAKLERTEEDRLEAKRREKKLRKRIIFYANNPVSFIGRGLESEEACATPVLKSSSYAALMEGVVQPQLPTTNSSSASGKTVRSTKYAFASFESHTNGFASRMMAKMGFEEGHGLGRNKQGIAQPLEAVIRPRSLGLGASNLTRS